MPRSSRTLRKQLLWSDRQKYYGDHTTLFKTEGTGCELVSASHRYWTEAFAQQYSTPTVEDQMLQKGRCTVILNSLGMYRIRIPVSGKIPLSGSIWYPVKFYRIFTR